MEATTIGRARLAMETLAHDLIWDKLNVHDHHGLIGCETSRQEEVSTETAHSVYPNPAMQGQSVVLTSGRPFGKATVLNAAGQTVKHLQLPPPHALN